MNQQTLAMAADQNAGFEQFRKPTRRDEFLQTMDMIMPWADLCAAIEPFYPKGVGGCRTRVLKCSDKENPAHPREGIPFSSMGRVGGTSRMPAASSTRSLRTPSMGD